MALVTAAWPPHMYRRYMLGVLMLILAFSYVDRLALGLVLQDIKVALDLSDAQLGLLSGIAFALFYSAVGIPLARWADRGDRVLIISACAALWSVAVIVCGFAASFLQLMLIRVAVAVGEAGCIPPAHSLIADEFSRRERPRALAIYCLGGPLSFIIGYFIAGWLNELYGWRVTFIALGMVGLILPVVAWLTLHEPRRASRHLNDTSMQSGTDASAQLAFGELSVLLWRNLTFRHLLFCFSVMQFFSYGVGQWTPAFFIRSHGLQTGELGSWFALIFGGGGLIGTYLGGALASRGAATNERVQLGAMAIVLSSFGIISAATYLAPNLYVAFTLMALAAVAGAAINGPLFATIQTVVPSRIRAVSVAIIYLFANLIGMGLGPFAAGALSDALRPHFAEESLRYALLALCPGYCWAAWHLWQAGKTVACDLAATRAEESEQLAV
ncbi:spinster family MFS transporter [Steroidobacter sp.]|uniref:spinster family MFS transporter n=1 Tax=Steroidobacter sp. TaxID=1978227 RepID=UPI001A42245C|nr:MFS transporter [Steroidobacter sp.]MBL8266488.1 MFS transporter [Steroidobacter sp.]